MRRSSLAFRLVALAALWSAAVLLLGGLVLSGLFRDSVERAFDARLAVLLEGLVAAAEIDPQAGLELTRSPGEPRFEQPLSGWYWQIEGGVELLRSRSLWDGRLDLPALRDGGTGGETLAGPAQQQLRLVQRRIYLPEAEAPFLFAVAGDRTEIEAEIDGFNATLAWALALLVAGLVAAVLIQVRIGLLPLRRLGQELASIRAGGRERLDEALPAEIAPLAHELNALIDHNAEVVERARTHGGNLAHGLKTPLSVLLNDAGRASGPLAQSVRRQAEAMQRQIDHHLVRARAAATARVIGARTELGPVVGDLVRTIGRIHARRGIEIEAKLAPALAFRGERQDLEEMLGNLLDNACKWARREVCLTARAEAGRLVVTIDDDGPGLAAQERDAVLARGTRLDESVPGSGLGLGIVKDIAQLYGGAIALEAAPAGGLRARLALPAAGA